MKITKSKIFLILCLSFIAGVLIAPVLSKLIIIFAAIGLVTVACVWWDDKYVRLAGFAGLILLAGCLRFETVFAKNNLAPFYDQQAQVSGVISEEPDIRSDKIYLTVDQLSINGEPVRDKILVSVYTSRNFAYGEQISFTGKILEPSVFDDFNYKNYLSRFGIDAVVYYPNPDIMAADHGNKIKSMLLSVKESFVENLSRVLPEPQNAFLAGLLVGAKHSIPQDLTDAFAATGTSHIVAISGYNISIIIAGLAWILRDFRRRVSSTLAVLIIVGFVILSGATASVVRAAIVGVLALLAVNLGRRFAITNALVLTAAIMIFINPKLLLFDVGFQLSFLALMGIVYLEPLLVKYFRSVPRVISGYLLATLSAQIFTLPILLYNFGQLSLVAPLTNVLVLPLVPLTMLAGFVTGLSGYIFHPLANVLAWPAWVLLSYIIEIIRRTALWPASSINVNLNLIGIAAYYAALASLLWFLRLRQEKTPAIPVPENAALYKPENFG
ncbi:MAG TPA: ComEC/Rec2 family competence protein [Patescibacteria group bacterium]|nr:ComEC/Rec2 family competence protein [Patescibacteria group bacterium]